MRNRTVIAIILLIVTSLAAEAIRHQTLPEPFREPGSTPSPTSLTGNVTVHFIDVGQGNAIFIDTPNLDMLIDGGTRRQAASLLSTFTA